MRFAMLICGVEEEWGEVGSEADVQGMEIIQAWVEKWQAAGKIAPGGEELDSTRKAKTLRPGPDGKPMVLDGPYLELKEVIGGFLVLEADDIDEAVAIAAGWPLRASSSIEIRPCMER